MTTIQVKVKPNSRVSSLEQGGDGVWLARLKSPPVDGKTNMHSEWDAIPKDLHAGPDKAVMQRAQQIPATPGEIDTWAASWASDTLRGAHTAFIGVSFSAVDKNKKWTARYADRKAYEATQGKLKREQLAKGGARLAQIFKTIWP